MKSSTKHVALDVHQATTLASVREDSGRVIARSILPTEAPALVEFFRGMRGTIHVVFEEGTQAQWLHDLLVRLVDRGVAAGTSAARTAFDGRQRYTLLPLLLHLQQGDQLIDRAAKFFVGRTLAMHQTGANIAEVPDLLFALSGTRTRLPMPRQGPVLHLADAVLAASNRC